MDSLHVSHVWPLLADGGSPAESQRSWAGRPLTSQTPSQMRITCGDVNCGLIMDTVGGAATHLIAWTGLNRDTANNAEVRVEFSWVCWTNPEAGQHTESNNHCHHRQFTFYVTSSMFNFVRLRFHLWAVIFKIIITLAKEQSFYNVLSAEGIQLTCSLL